MPSNPLSAPLTSQPQPQYGHLVVKSGTTAGRHSMSSACGSGWCFVRCTLPHWSPPYAPSMPPSIGIWWPRVILTCVSLTLAHTLLSAIDHLECSRVVCNRQSSFFICNPQCHPMHPIPSVGSPDTLLPPQLQYRHLVVKSGTTAGQHNMSSACGSRWCFVKCTLAQPSPHMPPQCLQAEVSGGQAWY